MHEIKVSFTSDLFDFLTAQASGHQMFFQEYVSQLTYHATLDANVIRSIAAWFRRGFKFATNECYIGRVIAPKVDDLLPEGKRPIQRSIKLPQNEYLRVCEVATALGCAPAKAATILLFAAQTCSLDIATKETEESPDTVKIGSGGV